MDTAFLTLSSPGAGGTKGQLQEGSGLHLSLIVHSDIIFLGFAFSHSLFSLFFRSVMR